MIRYKQILSTLIFLYTPPLNLNNEPIPNSDKAMYLGLAFDKQLL